MFTRPTQGIDTLSAHADVEISVHRRDGGRFGVELRMLQPDADAEQRMQAAPAIIEINREPLIRNQQDPLAYGRWLSEHCLFHDADLRAEFVKAFDLAQSQDALLRLRLFLGPDVTELHSLRWETLTHPVTGLPLASDKRVAFSRYLSSMDWRPVRLRRRSELRALVLIGNPQGLGDYGLATLDPGVELDRVVSAMPGIKVSALCAPGEATLERLENGLSNGCDILYIVCHGTLKHGESWLWLEDEASAIHRVPGAEIVNLLQTLDERPSLVVLAACQGAGSGATEESGGDALSALGPRLAEAGIPAVLAMQGNIDFATHGRLMAAFFEALQDPDNNGEVDRALSVARFRAREELGWWAPALFMRLRSGRIWYVPGFAGQRDAFEQWQSIVNFVRLGQVVPILGPDMAPQVYGEMQDLALDLAEANDYPLSVHEQNDLAKVSQYVSIRSSIGDARTQVRLALKDRLQRRAAMLGDESAATASPKVLLEFISERLMQDPAEPLRVLADLNARVFVNAAADPLLETALARQGKSPIRLIGQWRDEREDTDAFLPDTTPERPYVHYIFGDLRDDATWVLTEDDFFDCLIRTSLYYDLIPSVVSKALTGNCLLFLGFRLDDWRFRILFRMILAKGGSAKLRQFNHVGVQISPDAHGLADVERAKRYLERYFLSAQVDIYWGSATDFLRELHSRLQTLPATAPAEPVGADAGDW